MEYCKKCLYPGTRPRLNIDETGVCQACRYAEEKKLIPYEPLFQALLNILKDGRNLGGSQYDCVIPCSGGKDSFFIVGFILSLGYKPLIIRIEGMIPTPQGEANFNHMMELYGVDYIRFGTDYTKASKKRFIEKGDPFYPWVKDVYNQIEYLAHMLGISLIIYGENGELEYNGNKESTSFDIFPSRYNVKRIFLGDYINWNTRENISLAISKGMKPRKRAGFYGQFQSIDDYMDDLYLWLTWPKFGYCITTKYASVDIREGTISREDAIEMMKQYEGEFPHNTINHILKYLKMEEKEFWPIVEKFINPEIWVEESGTDPSTRIFRHKFIKQLIGEERYLEIPQYI